MGKLQASCAQHLGTKPEQCTRDPKTGKLVPPPLAFDILDEIMQKLPGFPIVLHGSSSVPQKYVDIINKYGGKLPDAVGIPELSVALSYLAEGGYYWNSGLFLWEAATAEAAIRKFQPDIAVKMDEMAEDFYTPRERNTVRRVFPECKSISIDYAVMEPLGGRNVSLLGRESGVCVLPADFGWSDLGTWGSLHSQLEKDADGNSSTGGTIRFVESSDCIVRTSSGLKIVLQGLEGFIVAEDGGTMLICQKHGDSGRT